MMNEMKKTTEQYNQDLLQFIHENPDSYHVIEAQKRILKEHGYVELSESSVWELIPGGKYYVTRNDAAIAAFRIPHGCPGGFMIMATHADSPALKVKKNPEMTADDAVVKLNVETYGGLLMAQWLDRPLSISGRVVVKTKAESSGCHNGDANLAKAEASGCHDTADNKAVTGNDAKHGAVAVAVDPGQIIESRLINIDRDLLVIPGLAIHMNREANKGYSFNAQKDLLPLYGEKDGLSFAELIAEAAGVSKEDVLDYDLFVYNRQPGCVVGAEEEFLMSPRLDDAQCVFASLTGFLESEVDSRTCNGVSEKKSEVDTGINDMVSEKKDEVDAGICDFSGGMVGSAETRSIPVHVVFDNEEVGSSTRQGAASTFLADTLERINESLARTSVRSAYLRRLSESFMLSADNAHAIHPNHPDKCDPVNHPHLNGGVVLKYSANQKYTTDAVSGAIVRVLAERAGIGLQEFHNRSDLPGGSTLGNLSGNQVAVCTADVGIAQLAMHSPCETCGARDTADMVALAKELYMSSMSRDGRNLRLIRR